MTTLQTTLGDLVAALYEAALEESGDETLAGVIAETVLNEMVLDATLEQVLADAA